MTEVSVFQLLIKELFRDLLIIDKRCILLIEAKAMSVIPESVNRTTERRVGNIVKQIRKATRQLRGAYNEISRNGKMSLKTPGQTQELEIKDFSVHLIILISEAYADIARHEVASEVIALGKELNAGVHVLDLAALSLYIRRCRRTDEFLQLLDRRWALSLSQNMITFAGE